MSGTSFQGPELQKRAKAKLTRQRELKKALAKPDAQESGGRDESETVNDGHQRNWMTHVFSY